MKIFDHKRKEFLPVNNVGWSFRDLVSEKYEGIQIIKPTGFFGLQKGAVNWIKQEVYEFDILSVILKSSGREIVEGHIEWNCKTGQFLFRRFDNGNVVWMNGLYEICILDNLLLT